MYLQYEPAQADDVESIFSFNKEQIETYENLESIDYGRVLAWVHRKIVEHIHEYTCVRACGQKAGYFYFHQAGAYMELDDLYVFPAFRNRGIGTAILQKCCGESSLPIDLYVFSKNAGALALYGRLGFRVIRRIGDTRCLLRRDSEG